MYNKKSKNNFFEVALLMRLCYNNDMDSRVNASEVS